MTDAFADSFYFLALSNPQDEAHEQALRESQDKSRRIVTTAWVLTEVGDALSSPPNRRRFVELLDILWDDPQAVVIPPTIGWFQAGVSLYRARADKEWSLTDCISFAVMRHRKLTNALTGDRHFEQAGFKVLLKPRR